MRIGKIVRRFSLILGFVLVTLLALAIIIPNLYEAELKQLLKEEVNKRIKAELDFTDLDLSLLSSFPDFQLKLSQPQLTGIEEFIGLQIFKSEDLKLDLDFGSVIRDRKNILINEVQSAQPIINLLTNELGNSNWDIVREPGSTEENMRQSDFNLRVDHIRLQDGRFEYTDLQNQSKITLEEIDLLSKGRFHPEGFDMDSKLRSSSIYYAMNGVPYLNHASGEGDVTLQVNTKENKYVINDGSLTLNALPLFLEGFIDINSPSIEMDLNFKAASSEVKNFVSLLPNAYTTSFTKIQSSGLLSLQGSLKGIFDAVNKKYPKFKIGLKIDNGRIKFPDLPLPITNINTQINVESLDDQFSQIKVNADQFAFNINDQPIEVNLEYLRSPFNSQYAGSVKGNMDLQSLAKAYPLPQVESLLGSFNADLNYRFNENQIRQQNYQDIQFEGVAEVSDLQATFIEYPSVDMERMSISAKPNEVNAFVDNLALGKSEINSVKLDVTNPLSILLDQGKVDLKGSVYATQFYADEWIQSDTFQGEINNDTTSVLIPEYLAGNVDFDLNALYVSDYQIQDLSGNLGYNENQVQIRDLNGKLKSSDFNLNGTVRQVNEWLSNQAKLNGDLDLKSNQFIVDDWMPETENGKTSATDSQSLRPIVKLLPNDMELTIRPRIKDLSFKDASWQDLQGQVNLIDQSLELRNMTSRLFGGTMNFEGIYNEQPSNPVFSIKYDASKLQFRHMFESFAVMKKLAPIARFIDGIFNTNLVLEGELTDGYLPVWDKLKAAGFLETLEGVVDGFKPLKAVADQLQLKVFEKFSLKDSKNWFEVIDGKVAVKEFTRQLDDIDLRISGNHAIDNDLDYFILAAIPRTKFDQIPAGQEVNRGLEWLNKEASKVGMDLNAGDFVNVQIHLTGNILNPTADIRLVDISGKSLDEAIKDKVVEEVTELKDSVQQEVEQKVEEVKDTITSRVEEEIDKAEEQLESEAKRIADSLKVKAEEQAKEMLDSTGKEILGGVIDSFITPEQKEKAEDVLEKEVDKVKDVLKDWNPFKKKNKADTTKKKVINRN